MGDALARKSGKEVTVGAGPYVYKNKDTSDIETKPAPG